MTFGTQAPRVPSSLPISISRTFALRRGRAQWLTLVLGCLVLLALPYPLPLFWTHLANGCLIAVIGAVALNVLTGNARLVSLGQAAFLGIGAFAAGLLYRAYNVPFPVALGAAAIAGGAAGFLIALLSLRLRALYVAVTTLVLHFAVTTWFSFVQAVFLDSSGIILPLASLGFMELRTPMQWYYFLLVVTTLVVLGALNLLRSFVGRRWIAVGEHDLAAEALGVPVRWAKLSVFAVTSAVTAFAGALSAYYVGTVSFESYHFGLAITYLAMIIVGGVGSVLGSVLGAVFITLLPYVLDQVLLLLDFRIRANVLAGIHQIAFGALIVAFLLFEPRGLAEIWRRIRSAASDWPFRYRSVSRGTR
jgi:branched-chain amino acid transport system permease protein